MDKAKVRLVCELCLNRNYNYLKSKNSVNKLELKKYCEHCRKHTLHKETR